VQGIVGCLFAIEVDGGGARGFGVVGHLEFIGGGLLELGLDDGWGGEDKKQEGRAHEGVSLHGFCFRG